MKAISNLMKDLEFKQLTRNQEKLILSLSRRRKRKQHGLCICEGLRSCGELYASNPDLIYYGVVSERFAVETQDLSSLLSTFAKKDFYLLSDDRFDRLTSTVNSQGILFVAEIPSYHESLCAELPFILVLDRIADPGNFGTIMRTALSVGLDEIWYSAGTVDPFSEKTIRSALGAQFRLKLREFDDLPLLVDKFIKQGFKTVYRTEPAAGDSCFEVKGLFDKSIIVFGNEASGVGAIEKSVSLHIPMPGGYESINVAQAVTVILFDAVRRKVL
jgi:RNA methyltransferase, TrmH family